MQQVSRSSQGAVGGIPAITPPDDVDRMLQSFVFIQREEEGDEATTQKTRTKSPREAGQVLEKSANNESQVQEDVDGTDGRSAEEQRVEQAEEQAVEEEVEEEVADFIPVDEIPRVDGNILLVHSMGTEDSFCLVDDSNGLHLSRFHPGLAQRIREDIQHEMEIVEDSSHEWHVLRAAPQWTFALPDFSLLPSAVRGWIDRNLFQKDHQKALSECVPPILNWNDELTTLYPLFTQGDGNCLLHAVSLGMYGVHDRELTLRKALHWTLTGRCSAQFRERWMEQAAKVDRGAIRNQSSLEEEWRSIVRESTPMPTSGAGSDKPRFEYLSQFHIFVLAHVLRRPIIVYADKKVRDIDTDEVIYELPEVERMDGIYLPILWPQEVSRADPLALSFHSSHFAPLVAISDQVRAVTVKSTASSEDSSMPAQDTFTVKLPLMDSESSILPIHFLTSEESARKPEILDKFLSITHTKDSLVLCCTQMHGFMAERTGSLFQRYLSHATCKAKEEVRGTTANRQSRSTYTGSCVGECGFSGSANTGGYCSVCYKKTISSPSAPVRSPCRGGCGFYGSVETGYCSKCSAARATSKELLQSMLGQSKQKSDLPARRCM